MNSDADTSRMPSRTSVPTCPISRRQLAELLVLPSLIGVAVYQFGLPLEPDASYYVGGVALFPSPLGTVLGTLGGYSGLAALNGVASFAIVLLVGLISRGLGGQPLIAQALALVIARASWFEHWGMDSPGVALLLAAVWFYVRGVSWWALVFVCLAVSAHPAVLPLVLGALAVNARRRAVWIVALGLVGVGAALAYGTGYKAGFELSHHPGAFAEGVRELVLACWPLLLLSIAASFHPRMRTLFIGSAVGAILAGAIPASLGQIGLTRYAVPCVFIAVAGIRLRGAIGARTHQGSSPSEGFMRNHAKAG